MTLAAKHIKNIYASNIVRRYDASISHFFNNYKKRAIQESSLKNGDKVLVYCCGTGLDFSYILEKIGPEGKIIGVDFSPEMLKMAENKIEKNQWKNIELINADVTKFKNNFVQKADAGVCTLGMSIIPDFKSAYYSLLSNVNEQGAIVIGDMQLASGWRALFNPITVSLSKRFGGTTEGHQNSLELCSLMKKELTDVKKKEFFLGAYYYCLGKNYSDEELPDGPPSIAPR